MLTVRDVTVRAGSRTLLDHVGFDVNPGEVVAIIGPNGAGKTTLLETVLGLRTADGGHVVLDETSVVTFRDRARAFSYLPDAAELPPELEVRTLLAHAAHYRPRPQELVEHLRDHLGVSGLLDLPCGILSRGERQRIALLAALLPDRPVLLLDEPFNAFDPLQLRSVLIALKQVTRAGARIVTTVHQLADAEKIADRYLLLADGRALAWGDLAALRSQANLTGGSLEDAFVALLEQGAHAT